MKPIGAPIDGLVVVYDLADFSKFLNTPNVQNYIAPYLDEITGLISAIIKGKDYHGFLTGILDLSDPPPELADPIHRKFLGDGELLIWDMAHLLADSEFEVVRTVLNRFWNIQNAFGEIRDKILDTVPILGAPPRIRFGIARGHVYRIQRKKESEYVGVSINLASRLQKYCPALSFIASTYVDANPDMLSNHNYLRVIAKNIRGFPPELVVVDVREFDALDKAVRDELFDEFRPRS